MTDAVPTAICFFRSDKFKIQWAVSDIITAFEVANLGLYGSNHIFGREMSIYLFHLIQRMVQSKSIRH